MKIDGSCHCGAITYAADIDPEKIVVCHCTDCQTLSGSTFRTVALTVADGFALLSGAPKIYVKTADSGARRQQAFCPDCGSPIYAAADDDGPRIYGIRVGTIRQRDQLVPKLQVWAQSRQHWLDDLNGVRKIDRQSQLALHPKPD